MATPYYLARENIEQGLEILRTEGVASLELYVDDLLEENLSPSEHELIQKGNLYEKEWLETTARNYRQHLNRR